MKTEPNGSTIINEEPQGQQSGSWVVTMKRTIAAAIGGILVAVAGVAVASNFTSSRQSDFFSPGKHQFYVWCAGASDYVATSTGRDAEDAQMKLYDANKAHGRLTCWPVWQGRVSA